MNREAIDALLGCVPGPADPHIERLARICVTSFLDRIREGEVEHRDLQVVSAEDEAIHAAVDALLSCVRLDRPEIVRLAVEAVLEFANEFRGVGGARDVWVADVYHGYLACSGLENTFDQFAIVDAA